MKTLKDSNNVGEFNSGANKQFALKIICNDLANIVQRFYCYANIHPKKPISL